MVITAAHITPLVALIAGILILIMPRLLNYIVAIYLIFIGLVGLNSVHHFINWHWIAARRRALHSQPASALRMRPRRKANETQWRNRARKSPLSP